MVTPKRLTRAEVYKQIDAFRGVTGRGTNGKLSLEQWVASKRADKKSPPRGAGNGKAMIHGWTRIRVGD